MHNNQYTSSRKMIRYPIRSLGCIYIYPSC